VGSCRTSGFHDFRKINSRLEAPHKAQLNSRLENFAGTCFHRREMWWDAKKNLQGFGNLEGLGGEKPPQCCKGRVLWFFPVNITSGRN